MRSTVGILAVHGGEDVNTVCGFELNPLSVTKDDPVPPLASEVFQ
jgi:hypothetical protein